MKEIRPDGRASRTFSGLYQSAWTLTLRHRRSHDVMVREGAPSTPLFLRGNRGWCAFAHHDGCAGRRVNVTADWYYGTGRAPPVQYGPSILISFIPFIIFQKSDVKIGTGHGMNPRYPAALSTNVSTPPRSSNRPARRAQKFNNSRDRSRSATYAPAGPPPSSPRLWNEYRPRPEAYKTRCAA